MKKRKPNMFRDHATQAVIAILLCLGCFASISSQEAPEMSKQKNEETYREYMERLAVSDLTPERTLALKMLTKISDARSLPSLQKVLTEGKEEHKILALEATGNIPGEEALKLLAESLGSDNQTVAVRAAHELAERPPAECIPIFIEGLKSEKSSVRSASIQGLIDRTGFRFGFAPEHDRENRSKSVERWETWWKNFQNDSPREWWVSMLSGKSEEVSELLNAIEQIKEKRLSTAIPQLITKLMDENEIVRDRAHGALISLTLCNFEYRPLDPEKDRSESVRSWKNWWEKHGEQQRHEWLLPVLTSENPANIERAAEELLYEKPISIIPNLIELLSNDRVEVRQAAHKILQGITHFTFDYKPLIKPVNQTESIARWKNWWENNQEKNQWQWYTSLLERTDKENTRVENRLTAAQKLSEYSDSNILTTLVNHGLTDPAEPVRRVSLETLIIKTGRSFLFRPDAPEEQRSESLKQWEKWLTQQKEEEKKKEG